MAKSAADGNTEPAAAAKAKEEVKEAEAKVAEAKSNVANAETSA